MVERIVYTYLNCLNYLKWSEIKKPYNKDEKISNVQMLNREEPAKHEHCRKKL